MSQLISVNDAPSVNIINNYIKNISDAQTSLFYYLESRLIAMSEPLEKEFIRLEAMRSLRFLTPEQQDAIRRLL